ncbi:mannitol dehydrogenase family protein [Brachybacterium fresconis]|uniref:Mannitol-1-phosphate 5-dehydrogenase n=1 Tax=Brachybacterium fresconis TaxID=173363 RepID=A0ABS4YK27_9MICO|nr:mannitol dehydrogenase family protein [Brachybacterium fresconis]MBP2409084.1 mannitol 2-dehydrogenase [Brachybacterium fresconis]
MTALNASALPDISARGEVAVPQYPLDQRAIGIVHFGVGGFHRAHQAMFLDRLMNAGRDRDWAICGVGLLPGDARMRDALTAQDGMYTLVTKNPDGERDPRVIGSIAKYLFAPDDPEAVLAQMTDPAVRIVSLTVTEGGYNYNPSTGEFQYETEAVAADLSTRFDSAGAADVGRAGEDGGGANTAHGAGHPRTMFGFVVEALRRRREAGTEPFTVMSCDNVRGNGDLAQRMILAYARRRDENGLHGQELMTDWIEQHVAFPNCMVDRITPATVPEDIEMISADYGIDDAWPVVAEDFVQWVLEDEFPAGRPAYEEAGVQMVEDVEPYELMKLRLLNCSHQSIAYFGLLLGLTYADEAAVDEHLAPFARTLYMDVEGTPTVPEVPGIDLTAYKDELMARFANEAIKDTLARLAAESSDRIPTWMMPVIRENLEAERSVTATAAIVASWARYAEGTGENGEEWPVVDRLHDRVMAAAAKHDEDPLAFLRDEELFGDLVEHEAFTAPYLHALEVLRTDGARALLKELVGATA